jgi:hypothetical protein
VQSLHDGQPRRSRSPIARDSSARGIDSWNLSVFLSFLNFMYMIEYGAARDSVPEIQLCTH